MCNRARIEIANDLPPASKTTRGTGIGLRLTNSLIRAMPGWKFDTEHSSDAYRAIVVAPAAYAAAISAATFALFFTSAIFA